MSTGTYTPKAGSIAARVLESLRESPEAISTTLLASLVGETPGIIQGSLHTALTHGAVKKEVRDDGRAYWSLGDGTPTPPEPGDLQTKQRTIPAPARDPAVTAGVRSVFDLAPKPKLTEAEVLTRQAPIDGASARYAMWNDGSMLIRRGADDFTLTGPETRELVAFLLHVEEQAA